MLMTPETVRQSHQNQHLEKDSKLESLTELKPSKLVLPLPQPLSHVGSKSQKLHNSPPTPQPPPPSSPEVAKGALPPPPPPQQSLFPSRGSGPPPPPPRPLGASGAPPPPPPVSGGTLRSLLPKKTTSKLKRSTELGNLYRTLKGKVEGAVQDGKSSNGRKGNLVNSTNSGGKQGMADALAEMTRKSSYFQQIEEDVRKYTKSIMEIKVAISSFQTKDMDEILKFHKDVEAVLEHLTDESQVLSRFEGFPIKKVEALRTAVALHKNLDNTLKELQNWKFEAPIGQILDNVERYFDKMRVAVGATECTKDEELKKLRSNNIDYDFVVLIRIKESMVDVSSSCMEIAIKDKREANQAEDKIEKIGKKETKKKGNVKMLWRAFQLAVRVYTFAGGYDYRAENLTRELAQEINSDL